MPLSPWQSHHAARALSCRKKDQKGGAGQAAALSVETRSAAGKALCYAKIAAAMIMLIIVYTLVVLSCCCILGQLLAFMDGGTRWQGYLSQAVGYIGIRKDTVKGMAPVPGIAQCNARMPVTIADGGSMNLTLLWHNLAQTH